MKRLLKGIILNILLSIRAVKDGYKTAITIVLADMLFLFAYGFFTAPLFDRILDYITAIAASLSGIAGDISREYAKNPSMIQTIMSHPGIADYLKSIILLFIIIAVIIYLLYAVFHGFAWWSAHRITGSKVLFVDYMKRFALVNIPFMLIFMIYHAAGFLIELQKTVAERMGTSVTGRYDIILLAVFILLIYFTSIAYALIAENKAWKSLKGALYVGIRRVHIIWPYYILILAVFALLDIFISFSYSVNAKMALITGVILLFPAIAWARVLVAGVIGKKSIR